MSLRMKVLEEYKVELISALEVTDLVRFSEELYKCGIISYDAHHDFSILDHNRLDSILKARYLLQVVLNILQEREYLYDRFIPVLIKCAKLGNFLGEILRREIVNTECQGTLSRITEIGAECLRSDSSFVLREVHIPNLVTLLADCTHKWEEIGIALGLPINTLEECRNGSSNAVRLHRVISSWYQSNKLAYLKTLKEVLEMPYVAMSSVAYDLEERVREMIAPMDSKTTLGCSVSEYQSGDTEVSDGKSTLLGVQVPNNESVSYHWTKDVYSLPENVLGDNDTLYSGVHSNILYIRACQGMEGKYICSIQYDNEVKRKEVALTILYSPDKECLLKRYSLVKEVPRDFWPPVGTSTFIKLALINNSNIKMECDYSIRGNMDDIMERKNQIDYEELFRYHEQGIVVLIEGRPGSGKTTLTHKLTKDWATKPYFLRGAKLVFLTSLRILSSCKMDSNLSDILEVFYSDHAQRTKMVQMIERKHGEGVCFIIDGLDEYLERDNPTNIIKKLLHKEYLPSAMVIVASRPIGTVELRHSATIKKRIEILGFSKDQILNYVDEYFKGGCEVPKLQDYLGSHINVFHMCYLPVHTAMICFIHSQPGVTVPNTETKVYECFTLLTIKRKLERDGDKHRYSALNSLEGDVRESFSKVCKLAFDMTISSKQTAIQSDSEIHLSDGSGCDVHSLGLVTIDATARLFGFEDLYSFLHLTFQEYLAAFHISILKEDEQENIIISHVDKKEMLMVWKFFCNLADYKDPGNINLQLIMNSKFATDLYRTQCALESQQQVVCDSIFYHRETGALSFKDHIFLPTDFNAIGYVISNVSGHVIELVMENCTLEQNGIITFIEVCTNKLKHIKSIHFSTKSGSEQFHILNILLKEFNHLEMLSLINAELRENEVKALTHNITLPCLKVLKISMPLRPSCLNNLSFNSTVLEQVQYLHRENDFESPKRSLLHLLKSFNCEILPLCNISETILSNIDIKLSMVPKFLQLSALILVNCNLDDYRIEYLKKLKLENNPNHLETLRLDFNKITCAGAKILSQVLVACKKIAHLSISCNKIGNQGAISLAGALIYHHNLLELDLECNAIGDEGAVAIAEIVRNFPASFELHLWNINITPEGTRRLLEHIQVAQIQEKERPLQSWKYVIVYSPDAISRAIQCCTYLQTLNLSGRRISANGTVALARTLKHCINLRCLNLNSCRIGWDGMKALSSELSECKQLQVLSLGNNKIDSEYMDILALGLKGCVNLKELNLHHNDIGSDGLEALTCELKDCNLETLNLQKNGIDSYGAAALARALRSGFGQLIFEAEETDIRSRHLYLFKFLSEALYVSEYNKDSLIGHRWYSSLLTINLGNNKICSEGAAALAYGFKYCRKLQSLDLQENYICEDGAEVLANELKSCTTLQTLILDNNEVNVSGTAKLSDTVKSCINLQTLSLAQNNITSSGAAALSDGLQGCFNLQTLNLDNNNIDSSGAIALARGLRCCKQLQELNIGRNCIDSEGTAELIDGLQNCCSLRTLDLHDNSISTDGMRALAGKMRCTQLQHLRLKNIDIGLNDMSTLSEGLKHCHKIEVLDLSLNKISSAGAAVLSEGLKCCENLQILNLTENAIGIEGAVSLAGGLKNTSLKVLNLNINMICSTGAMALVAGLKRCNNLEELYLSKNEIGSDGASAVADWLISMAKNHSELSNNYSDGQNCIPLKNLNVGHNNIGLQGITAIARALYYCTKLQILDLQSNNICPDGTMQLAKGLKSCVSLRTLTLDNNQICSVGISLLGKELREFTSLRTLSLTGNGIDSKGAEALAESLKYSGLQTLDLSKNNVYATSELTDKLKYCNIYTRYGLTNQKIRWQEYKLEQSSYSNDIYPDSYSD